MKFFSGDLRGVARLLFFGTTERLETTPTFQDPKGTNKPFNPHYQRHILPFVREFESKRIVALQKHTVRLRISAFLFLAMGTLFFLLSTGAFPEFDAHMQILKMKFQEMNVKTEGDPLLFLIVTSFSLLFFWTFRPVMNYNKAVKDNIYPNIFSFFGSDFSYKAESPLSVDSLEKSDIIPGHDDETSEDYIKGRHADVGIEMFETKLTETSGSGKNRRTTTVFRGLFILLDMNKNFSGKTIVVKDWGKIGNWMNGVGRKLEVVRLEDPKFEDMFEVYSSDQVEARYLLTTSFMERLIGVRDLIGSDRIQCSFYDNKILLMVSLSSDRFEVSSIYRPTTFIDECKGILAEMDAIFALIDHLKLNQKIGL